MAVENPADRNPVEQPSLEFIGTAPVIKTSHVDWGTKTAYDITIRTFDPNVLALATLRADSNVIVKVAAQHEPRRANTRQENK